MNVDKRFRIAKMRARRNKAEEISDAFRAPYDLHGWFYRGDEPMQILRLFPELRLKDGYMLHGCRYVANGNGNGLVCAIREENCHFDLPSMESGDSIVFPISIEDFESAEGTLPDFREAIEGDGTPWSYFSASILARELLEYGALWHGVSWYTYQILDAPPWASSSSLNDKTADARTHDEDWTWVKKPDDWRPRVEFIHGRPRVTFYAMSELSVEHVTEFVDSYSPDTCVFESKATEIAVGSGGYIF